MAYDLSDEHYRLITPDSNRIAVCCIPAFEHAKLDYVLIGGWACACYGSPTPSIDTDIFLPTPQIERLTNVAAESCGVIPNGKLQVLAIDKTLAFTPRTVAEQRGVHGFRPDKVIMPEHVVRGSFRVFGTEIRCNVPDAPTLAFLKLKAWRDRSLAWNAKRDPALALTLTPESQALVRDRQENDWMRKAGKDLYDLAILLEQTSIEKVLHVATKAGIRGALEKSLNQAPPRLVDFAKSLQRRKPETPINLAFLETPAT